MSANLGELIRGCITSLLHDLCYQRHGVCMTTEPVIDHRQTHPAPEGVWSYIPRILAKITREFQRGLSGQEGALGYAEQIECLTLQLGELQGKGLDELVVAEQGVTFGEAEEAQDLFGGGTLAEALFGVEG